MPTPNATLTIQIDQFRPLGGVFPITATLALTAGDPTIFTLVSNELKIRSTQPTQITFSLPDPGHTLLGVAFDYVGNQVRLGVNEFPTVLVQRGSQGSSLTVTDQGQVQGPYAYLLLVQSLRTGEIGVIDPSIDNDNEG